MSVAAVVLAGGGGRRYRGPTHKLLAPWAGTTVVGAAVDAALLAGFDEAIVVTGAVDLAAALVDRDVTTVDNPAWADGQATSLAAGVAAADRSGHDAVVVGLGDQPAVGAAAWRAVRDAVGGPIVVADYGGDLRPPVRLDRAAWSLLPTTGDDGARSLWRHRPDLVTTVTVDGDPTDVDTVDDLPHRPGGSPWS